MGLHENCGFPPLPAGGGGAATQEQIDDIAGGIGIVTPSTPDAILDAVDGLISDANETTGETDADLTTAVGTLIDGYGKGGTLPDRGVYFLDYDGSIVTAWATDEVAGKTALPDNPTHTRLVSQGWNWTLLDLKNYVTRNPAAKMLVGQIYKTASGMTEVDVLPTADSPTIDILVAGQKDWGDGTVDSTTEHTYQVVGKQYTIKFDTTEIPQGGSSASGLCGSVGGRNVVGIFLGKNVSKIATFALTNLSSMKYITLHDELKIGGSYSRQFYKLYSLHFLAIPRIVTDVTVDAFSEGIARFGISVPDVATNFTGALDNYAIRTFAVPSSATKIGAQAFGGISGLEEIYFSGNSVPTLENVNAIPMIATKIIVPDDLYTAWTEATNWASMAYKIYKASEVA